MDKGLLSRLLKKLEGKGVICRKGNRNGHRRGGIVLTEKGCEIYHPLNMAADISVKETFAHLNDRQCHVLVDSMDTICRSLNGVEQDAGVKDVGPIVIRRIEEEDNVPVASMLRASVEEHDAPRGGTFYDDPHTDRMFQTFNVRDAAYWAVECDGAILGGCGFYPTVGLPDEYAELSKFHFRPALRGKGIGKRLLRFIERQAVKAGYTHMYLVSCFQFGRAVSMYEKGG